MNPKLAKWLEKNEAQQVRASEELSGAVLRQWNRETPVIKLRIPADRSHDTDLIIRDSLHSIPQVLALVRAMERVIEAHKKDKAAWMISLTPRLPEKSRLTSDAFEAIGDEVEEAESALAARIEELEV